MKLYNHDRKTDSVLTKNFDDKYGLLIAGIIMIGISIYSIIKKDYIYGIGSLTIGVIFSIISIFKLKTKKINLAYQDIVEEVNSGKIKCSLVDLGLDVDKIDYINEGTRICFGYAYDETCYFNACVSNDIYKFAIDLTDEVYDVEDQKFEEAFSIKSTQIIDVYDKHKINSSTTKETIYLAFIEYMKNNVENIKFVSNEANTLINQ